MSSFQRLENYVRRTSRNSRARASALDPTTQPKQPHCYTQPVTNDQLDSGEMKKRPRPPSPLIEDVYADACAAFPEDDDDDTMTQFSTL